MVGEELGGGSGNRKETEARDMKSKARSWGSPTLRRGRDWEGISPTILVTCKGIGGFGDVKGYPTNIHVWGAVTGPICLPSALFCQGYPQSLEIV